MFRRSLAAALSLALLLGTVVPTAGISGDPESNLLADTIGGISRDWVLVTQAIGVDPTTGVEVQVGKYYNEQLDRAAGVVTDTVTGAVRLDDLEQRRAEAHALLPPFERKADIALQNLMARIDRGLDVRDTIPVGIFVAADPHSAVDAVFANHPDMARDGDIPRPATLEAKDAIKRELHAARAAVYRSAEDAVAVQLEAMGATIVYRSTGAPLLFAEIPASLVRAAANLPGVTDIGLEGSWRPAMNSAGPTIQADWTSATNPGDQGTGIKVAVIEYNSVHSTGDLAGKVIGYYNARYNSNTPCYATDGTDHATWVAGAIASQNSTYKGVAPGVQILSAATCWPTNNSNYYDENDHDMIEAADWALSQGADILNLSLVQDTSTGLETARKYFDSVVDEQYDSVIAAAGNLHDCGTSTATTYEYVGSPGVGWNVLTVGGVDDKNTTTHTDDRLWYSPTVDEGACWVDPVSIWNPSPDSDFNKPEVSAPSVSVRTANGLSDNGTSVAAPMVAGIAAQLQARSAVAAANPNLTKALIMAGAIWGAPLPNGTWSTDHQGIGIVSAKWANNALIYEGGSTGGYHTGTFSGYTCYTKTFSVSNGQFVQVAAVWNSQTSGSNKWAKTDNLDADLDLTVTLPNGTKKYSWSAQNAWEFVDFTADLGGTVSAKVCVYRLDTGVQAWALAWIRSSAP